MILRRGFQRSVVKGSKSYKNWIIGLRTQCELQTGWFKGFWVRGTCKKGEIQQVMDFGESQGSEKFSLQGGFRPGDLPKQV